MAFAAAGWLVCRTTGKQPAGIVAAAVSAVKPLGGQPSALALADLVRAHNEKIAAAKAAYDLAVKEDVDTKAALKELVK